MDIKERELAKERIAEILFDEDWDEENGYAIRNASSGVWEEQTDVFLCEHYNKRADKILSIFEPVALEELTDEERYTVNIPCETCPSTCNFLLHPSAACMDCVVKCHAKATIAKNSKTQLYRIKGDL